MPLEQQYCTGRFLVYGLDEFSARRITRTNTNHFDRLHAWNRWDPAMNLRPWLSGDMKVAVERWLTDQTLSAETLALLPA